MAYLDGTRGADRDDRGRLILDDDLLLIVNGWWEPLTFALPDVGSPRKWRRELDTYAGVVEGAGGAAGGARNAADAAALGPGGKLVVEPRSLVLLRSARAK
jgi:glycogen operon protein